MMPTPPSRAWTRPRTRGSPRQPRRRPRGVAIVYVTVALVALSAFASLAVDLGHVQVAKTQLRRAADAAARYGAAGLATSKAVAKSNAIAAAADNLVDGSPLVLKNADVKVGTWSGGTFTSGGPSPNAVQISATLAASRGTAVSLMFGQVIGMRTCDVTATSVATYTATVTTTNTTAMGLGNVFLSGMPNGATSDANNPEGETDTAPGNSPAQVSGVTLTAGNAVVIDGVSGSVRNGPAYAYCSADGNSSLIVDNLKGAENGIGDIYAPCNALIGVFLGPSQPDQSAAPATLDFSNASSRDFTALRPQLQQPFFIGDGKTSGGVQQQFVVPTGATRLYLATMDGFNHSNDDGSFSVTLHTTSPVLVVK